jgi:hypothetical protein
MGKGFNSSWIVPSFGGALSMRLVIEGTIIIIVPLVTSFLLDALTLLVLVVNPVVCIYVTDDIAHVSVIPITPSVTLLQWSETVGRVPTRTLPMVNLMTPCFAIAVKDWVKHDCCIQHCLEVLYMCIDFFMVFRQVVCELVDEHSRGQGIVSQRVVDLLLSLVLDLANFLSD